MSILDELRRVLGLEGDDREKLDEQGLEPAPPLKSAGFVNPEGRVQPASSLEGAKAMAEGSSLARGLPPRGVRAERKSPELLRLELEGAGAKNPDETMDAVFGGHAGAEGPPEVPPALPPPSDSVLRAGRDLDGTLGKGRLANAGAALALARKLRGGESPPSPQSTGNAELELARAKYANPPEGHAEAPTPANGELPPPNPGPPPATPPPEMGEGGNPLLSIAGKLFTGAADPRTQVLRDALAKSRHMKELAGHITGMGIGADLVEGQRTHGEQGKGLADRADDEVRDAMLPTKFEHDNARFDTEQADAAQNRNIRGMGEKRAEGADVRAGAEEQRKQKGFETAQGETDPKSLTSKNARASIEALYPKAWQRIPQEIRDGFSAADVKRIFGEVKMGDFAPKSAGGGIEDRMAQRLAAQAKLPNAGKILDLNDVLATIEAGKAPGTGYFMNKDGWQNFLRTPQGVAFKQKTQAIINKHIKDTTGLVVRESEEGRIMGELGYGSWDDASALDSGLHKMAEESQADLDQTLNKLPPKAKQMLEQQGAVPKIGGKYGRVIKGSTQNFGAEDTFNPRELLRRVLGRGSNDRTLGNEPMSADQQAAERDQGDDEENRRRGFRF